MANIRRSNKEIQEGKGRIDTAAFDALSDTDIERFAAEDGSDTRHLGAPRFVPAAINLPALRQQLGLSQAQFAHRFYLPLRSVQQWEQGQREPSEAARVLLFAISNDPQAIDRALHPHQARPS